MHPLLAVDLTGIGTLILAAATACLALLTRREVQNSGENIRIARDALLAQERPELSAAPSVAANAVAPQRIVSLSHYGKTTKFVGDVRVDLVEEGQVGLVSFELRNVGRGAAEIRRIRLMSLDSVREGGGPLYWEPFVEDRVRRVVAPDETLPVDLTMTTDKPSWFYRHVRNQTKLWVEVAYADLAGREEHVRWFEIQARRGLTGEWFIAGVLRDEPHRVRNLPPGAVNPFVSGGGRG
jgi:hypothetical protein